MANLKVSIVVRVSGPNGKRRWVRATGKNDPNGPLYLRYYMERFQKHVKAGRFYDEAEAAKVRLVRKLKAASMGLEVPREPGEGTNLHHWRDCLNCYITLVSGAIVIFLLWATSRTLGINAFEHLPDWLEKAYNAVWTSAVAGTAGIGLAGERAAASTYAAFGGDRLR